MLVKSVCFFKQQIYTHLFEDLNYFRKFFNDITQQPVINMTVYI